MEFVTVLIAGLLAVTLVAPVVSLPLVPLGMIGRRHQGLAPVVTFITAALSDGLAMLAFSWAARKWLVEPSFVAFLLIYLAVLVNGLRRLQWGRAGTTPVVAILQARGESYNRVLQIKMELGYLAGDFVGIWGVFLASRAGFAGVTGPV